MKSNVPWSVKGIEKDARETAKEAARREGMTVGEWLNQIIYSQAEGESSGGEVQGLQVRDIITAIEHLKNRVVEAEGKHARAVAELSRNMGAFVERVQRLERVKPAEGSYEDIAERVDRLERAGGDKSRVDALRALEKAIGQIAIQFNNAQRMTMTRLDSAESQLQEFAERMDRVGSGEMSAGEPAEIGSLQAAVENLAERVARAEQIASEAAELKDAAASSADPAFIEQTGARMRILGEEIKRGGDQIRALEGTIAKLSGQIEAAEKRSAEGVQKVSETIADVRTQLLNEEKPEVDASAMEAMLAEARRETDERIEAMHQALKEMEARFQTMEAAPAPAPAPSVVEAAAPETLELQPVDAVDDDVFGEIDEVVSSMETAAPAATVVEAEVDDELFEFNDEPEVMAMGAPKQAPAPMDEDEGEDFSFELDDEVSSESEEDEIVVSADADEMEAMDEDPAVKDARTLLAEVRNALTGGNFGADDDEEDDDAAAVLAALEEGDEDDSQAENTASLASAMALDTDQIVSESIEDELDELGAADAMDEPVAPTPKEDMMKAARRRAQEAAAARNAEEEQSRPRRGQLTPKQRAILAARARQKRAALAEEAAKANEKPAPKIEATAPAPAREEDDEDDDEPRSIFAKVGGAFTAMRVRMFRKKDGYDAKEAAKVAGLTAAEKEEDQNRNGDRAALETLQSTAAARPLTLALGVATLLAIAALAFLMKDVFIKGDFMKPAAVKTETKKPVEKPGAVATVPDAPALNPQELFKESISALNAAQDESAAAAAISKLQDAAALGFPPAQLQLGELYKTGQGVDQDLGQARIWFRRAANGGNVLAMHRIGVMTARGDGGPSDSAEAISWFERAANYGLVDSQYNLGAIYHPSEGGAAIQDAAKAYYWYSLAARNGDEQAQPLAIGVGATLPAGERSAIDKDVAAWKALEADPVANENGAAAG